MEQHANVSLVVCRRSMRLWRGEDHGGVLVLSILTTCLCEGAGGASVGEKRKEEKESARDEWIGWNKLRGERKNQRKEGAS